MKVHTSFALLVSILASPAIGAVETWRPLFPYDDFLGWEQKRGEWTLKEGVLSGKPSKTEDARLVSLGEYDDFELVFQYRLTGGARGRFCFRLNVQEENFYGLHMDISPIISPKESAQPDPIPKSTDWQSVSIKAVAENVEVTLNGETIAKGSDTQFIAGRLGFEIKRARKGAIEIKDIQIRELENEEGYESLFNGKDLSGWKIHGQDEQWKVEDGIILSESIDDAYSYLATEKEYKNFSIIAEFQGLANGNSGLFFHSHLDGTRISGIQAEVQPPTDKRLGHTGCLYDAAGRGWIVDPETLTAQQEGAFRLNAWNTIRVDVEDHHIRTWLNGLRIVDFQDDAPAHPSGVIALQIHSGGGVKVNWRNIRIKELR